jgi:hypothetical protein
MNTRYQVEIPIKEARAWLKAYFDGVRVPWGSRAIWLAGVQYVTDQPGVYLVGASGGLCGVQVIAPATEAAERKAS